MAEQLNNDFTEFDFTEEEDILAYSYSEIQIQGLRTELSKVARIKLELNPDVEGNNSFRLRHSYLQGKMDVLRSLIALSEKVKEAMEDKIARQRANEPQFKV